MKRTILASLAVLLATAALGLAAFPTLPKREGPSIQNKTSVRAVPSHLEVAPGQEFQVALDVRIAEGWWFYSVNPGDNRLVEVQEANITPQVAPLKVVGILWPPDQKHDYLLDKTHLINNVYELRAVAFVKIQVPSDAKAGKVELAFSMSGQVCNPDICLQMGQPDPYIVRTEVTVGPHPRPNPAWDADIAAAQVQARAPEGTNLSFWTGLGLALLAGMILNIMPCVLPVIPLKVLSLVEQAKESRLRMVMHGLAFAGGIMVFFAALAGGSAAVRAVTQQGIEWGKQFQSEPLRVVVSMIVVAVAANLFGLFNVNLPGFSSAGPAAAGAKGYLSSVATGILTAILSTPCSFGYLTAALAWAQLQPIWIGTLVLLTIGVGMALPYILLTAFPGLLRRLPKPGRWMELFKQSMGFVMLLVAVWLLGTLADEGADAALWAMAFGVVLTFGLWMWGTWVRYDATALRKWIVRGLAVATVALSGWFMLTPPRPLAVPFVEFDRTEIQEARAAGRPVLIDFTARWCLTCKTVEYRVYDDPEVAARLKDANVLVVRGDTTRANLPASRMLFGELHEPGVPVSVLFPPGGREPIRLHGIFSKQDLFGALDEAQGKP